MPHFNSLFILMEYKSLKTGTQTRIYECLQTSCDNRFHTGSFSQSLGNKCINYSSPTPLFALPTLPKTKLSLDQESSKSQQQDLENRHGEHKVQQDQLLGRDCRKSFPPSRKGIPNSATARKKKAEKFLPFFRATHASTLQSLACVSISEVTLFSLDERDKKKKKQSKNSAQ